MKKILLPLLFLLAGIVPAYSWTTPVLASPANATQQWVGVTFDWNAVTSSQAYQIQIDTLASFTSPVRQTVTKTYINSSSGNTDTQHNFSNLFFGKTYYWRVRAYITNDTSAWSTSTIMYTRDYVTLNSPGTSTQQWTGVTLDWLTHTGVSYYDMQCDTTLNFNSPALRQSTDAYINSSSGNTDTDEFLTGLYFGKTYYWRVRARNSVDTSSWSTPWTFVTRDYVTMNTPATSTQQWTGVTLDWLAHTGVSYYDVECDTLPGFNTPALRQATTTYVNSSSGNGDTEYFMTDLFFGKTYYWRVRARNSVDTSSWSTPWTFITRDYVTLNTPTTATQQWTGVTLDWLAHTGVDYYDVQCDTNASFISPALRQASTTYVNSSSGNGDTEYFMTDLFFGKTYYWRVRARNAVDTSSWGTVWTFITRDYVTLNTPTTATQQWTGITFDWLAHTGVDYYDMQCDTSMNFNSPALRQASTTYVNSSSGNGDTEYFMTDLFFGKTYYWRVRARNAVDTSSWATPWIVYTRDYVSLSYPVNGQLNVSTTGITLDWLAHTGVNVYQLQLDTNNLFASPLLVQVNRTYVNSSSSNSDTQYGTGALLANHYYFWRVRAINDYDTCAWTEWSFSTGNVPIVYPSVPTLITPANASINQSLTPSMTWNSSTNATSYEYQYDVSPNFTSPVSGTLTGTGITPATLNYNTTYYWRVRAYNNTIVSGWSATWNFTTQPVLFAPTLVSPADMSTGIAPASVILDWNDVLNATNYDYEYSTSPNFSSNVVSGNVSVSTQTISSLSMSTTYYWHIRASDGTNLSAWSATWQFATQSPLAAPLLVSPTDLSTGISTVSVLLDWNSVSSALNYDYEYSTDPNFLTSVISGNTTATSQTISSLAYSTTYYWHVRANDGVSTSAWSTAWSFTTEAQLTAPLLVSPADLSTGVSNASLPLTWNSVAGAGTYDYEYSTDLNFVTNVFSGNTASTAQTITALAPLTTYYWHVRAVNGSNVSPWCTAWSFTTDNSTGILTNASPTFSLYPNPASEMLTVHTGSISNGIVFVYDATGRIVLQQRIATGNTEMLLNVSTVENGSYFVCLHSENINIRQTLIISR